MFDDKQNRPIKVMARSLHSTCGQKMITENCLGKSLDIKDVVNIKTTEKNKRCDNQTVRCHYLLTLPLNSNTFYNLVLLDFSKNLSNLPH